MDLKIDRGEGLMIETPILDTLQSYEVRKRTRRSRQMMFLQEVVRRGMEVFVGVTLLSLLVTLFTGLSVVHSYTYYAASTFFFPLLTQVLERKYMFLVCNAILAFLIRCMSRSGFYASSADLEQQGGDAVELVRGGMMTTQAQVGDYRDQYQVEADQEEEDKALEVMVTGEPGDLDKQASRHHAGATTDLLMDDSEEKEDKNGDDHHVGVTTDLLMDDDEEKEDENSYQQKGSTELESLAGEHGGVNYKKKTNNAEMEMEHASSNIESTEELNQKIEEFIRKMKRELQLEVVDAHSPQHLIPAA